MKRAKYLLILTLMISTLSLTNINLIYSGKAISGVLPPQSGDWVIDELTIVSDEVLIINGSIIVENGGALVLNNTTIYMNLDSPGEYFIHVESGGNITILNSLITAYNTKNPYYFYVDVGASLRIENSTIKYSGVGQGIYSGLWIGADNATIINTDIWFNKIGILIYKASNVYIKNITVWYGKTGVYVYGAKNFTLTESDIKYQLEWSLWIQNTASSTISWSIFRGNVYLSQENQYLSFYQDDIYGLLRIAYTYNSSFSTVDISGKGIYLVDSYDNTMNNVKVDGIPIYYGEDLSSITVTGTYSQIFLVMCDNITVEYIETSGVSVGVELYLTNNSVIQYVNISDSDSGIILYGSSNNVITKNKFNNTQYGVEILGNVSLGNTIFLNDFINSSAYDDGYSAPLQNRFDNGTFGNYWSDYAGSDSNGDGIGDTPYIIDSNSNDTKPLVNTASFYAASADADLDGLPNIVELTKSFEYWVNDPSNVSYVRGTDPYNPDTDNDGLPDGQEVAIKTNPLDNDTDNDGLLDGQEILGVKANSKYPSDPHLYDTDSDGLSDGEECLIYGTNPADNDTDNDNISDYQEILVGLDPKNNDTDGDSFPDGYEVALGTDPKDPNDYPSFNNTATNENRNENIFYSWMYIYVLFVILLAMLAMYIGKKLYKRKQVSRID